MEEHIRATGIVETFNVRSGHGFIAADGSADAMWVHQRNVRGRAHLSEGDRVEFDVREGGMGLEATDVEIRPGPETGRGARTE